MGTVLHKTGQITATCKRAQGDYDYDEGYEYLAGVGCPAGSSGDRHPRGERASSAQTPCKYHSSDQPLQRQSEIMQSCDIFLKWLVILRFELLTCGAFNGLYTLGFTLSWCRCRRRQMALLRPRSLTSPQTSLEKKTFDGESQANRPQCSKSLSESTLSHERIDSESRAN